VTGYGDSAHLAGLLGAAAVAEELVGAIGIQTPHIRPGWHLQASRDLAEPQISPLQFALVERNGLDRII